MSATGNSFLYLAAKRVLDQFLAGNNPTFDELDKLGAALMEYEARQFALKSHMKGLGRDACLNDPPMLGEIAGPEER